MRIFKVPFDIKREEKIFGGYLSLRQVTYLMFCAGSLGLLAIHIPIIIKIFFILCAFLKINEQNFDKFFFLFIKYLSRKKSFVYRRCIKW